MFLHSQMAGQFPFHMDEAARCLEDVSEGRPSDGHFINFGGSWSQMTLIRETLCMRGMLTAGPSVGQAGMSLQKGLGICLDAARTTD